MDTNALYIFMDVYFVIFSSNIGLVSLAERQKIENGFTVLFTHGHTCEGCVKNSNKLGVYTWLIKTICLFIFVVPFLKDKFQRGHICLSF